MAIITPVGAFWLSLYGLTHDPEVFAPLVKQLGIWVVLGLHQDWEEPEIITSRRTMPLSGFWGKNPFLLPTSQSIETGKKLRFGSDREIAVL